MWADYSGHDLVVNFVRPNDSGDLDLDVFEGRGDIVLGETIPKMLIEVRLCGYMKLDCVVTWIGGMETGITGPIKFDSEILLFSV